MYNRANPYFSKIAERHLLTGSSSTKQTYHIVLDTSQSGLTFKVGDSIAVAPTNDPVIVEEILKHLEVAGEEKSQLRTHLLHKTNLSKVKPNPSATLLEYLKLQGEPLRLEALTKVLMPLLPRFYSIASSPTVYPNEVHLTVAHLSYQVDGQTRYGVGSHFLCQQAQLYITPIPIYTQAVSHFTLPENRDAPIILIGPGTGIAPFRAFIQERIATGQKGRNWIFFGERNRATDFYYSDFWLQLEKQNQIRLDLAFSRDQAEKVYVQHKLIENKRAIWNWLQEGAFLYVCGDAKKMAKDVEATLNQIVREEGQLTEEESRHYIKHLRTEKRYLLDVY